MHLWIRVLGTLAVVGLLTQPLWAPGWGAGVLGEVLLVPFPGNVVVVVCFLALVAAYCRTLQRTMAAAGAPHPRSVWWMFAVPANFVEDFYIVARVAGALDGLVTVRVRRGWLLLGLGWCTFQIVSLLPGTVGVVGGALAMVAWSAHWVMTHQVMRRLA